MKENFKLADVSKSNLYRVPDNYFEKLPGVVMARVTAGEVVSDTHWWHSLFYNYQAAFSSMFLIFSFVAVFFISQHPSTINTFASNADLSGITNQEALEYVMLQDNVDLRDVAELSLTDTDVSADLFNLSPTDILESVDEQQVEEVYFN